MEEDIDSEPTLSEGIEVEVMSDEEGFRGAWYNCTILKLPENKTKGKALVQYKHLVEEDNQTPLTESVDLSFIRPLPPQTQVPDDHCFQLNEVVDAFHLDGWWTGSVSQVLDHPKRYFVSFEDPPEEIEFSSSNLRPHWEWVNAKWVKPSKFQEVCLSGCQELVKLSCNTAKDAEATIQLESSNAVKSSSKRHKLVFAKASKEPAKNKQVKRTTPEGDATPIHTSKKLKHGSLANSSHPESESESEFLKCLRKKYGRRVKFNDEDPKHQDAEKIDNLKVVAAATDVSEVQKATKEVESSVTSGLPIECMSGSVTKEYRHVPREEMNLHKEHGMSGHQKEDGLLEIEQSKSVLQSAQSPSVDINDAAGVLEKIVPEKYKATEVEPSAVSGLEQAGTQTMSIERIDCQRKIMKVTGESSINLHENEEQSQLVGLTGDTEPEEGQDLPFVKSLPNWKTVESMEIFEVMPQNPHFHPLVKWNEILREGLAFGYMLSFASLVQKTYKLKVAYPRNHFTAILNVLPEFEALGFDVKAVRDRTSKLLSMKDRHGDLQHHSKEVEVQAKQCFDELNKINEEIDVNYKMVRELEVKQALLLSSKDSTISQITSLEVCADDTTKGIQKLESDFESLASSTW